MSAALVTLVFVAALLASTGIDFWLATRQARHVAAHRDAVPPAFAAAVPLEAHRKAAGYTLARLRLGLVATAWGGALALGWTLCGGLEALNLAVRDAVLPRAGGLGYQLALLGAAAAVSAAADLPLAWWSTFRLEQRFGFNRTTTATWLADQAKGLAVAALLLLPLAAVVLGLMQRAGPPWWLAAWAVWIGFQLLALVLVPTVIAPLFNRFEPLADAALAARLQALMQRCGFAARGLFVMDGSRRSAHGNAYFTGLGAARRVVVYDTLLGSLEPGEIEALLAHEIGHAKLQHLAKRVAWMALGSFAALALLGWLARQPAFYFGLGVTPNLGAPNDALALLLAAIALPPLGTVVTPWVSALMRRHEFEADAYACTHASAGDLARALVKLTRDNASTLTPDPLYARVYYSHPPAAERLAALPA